MASWPRSVPLLGMAAVLVVGCADESSIPLERWTLVTGEGARHEIALPTRVDDVLEERGAAFTLRTEVSLPEALHGRPVTLAIPRLPSLVELEVDGELVEPATTDLLRVYRSPGHHRWRIPADLTGDGTIALALRVQDTWFQSSWLGSTPRLAANRDGDRWYRFVTAFNIATSSAAFTTALVIGLVYLVVFLGDRSRSAYGWFAAQALAASVYPLFMLGASQVLLGVHDLRMLWIIAVASLVSIGYTHTHFRLRRPSRVWLGLGVASFVAMLVASGPYSARWGVVISAVGTLTLVIAYQLVVCLRLMLRGGRGGEAFTLVLSWIAMSVFAGQDLLYWLGWGGWLEGMHGASLGIACYGLLQSIALSRDHDRTLTQADALNTELAARVALLEQRDRENQRLADELKRQVSSRSRQLSHALARLGESLALSHELAADTEIDGRYRVVRTLGSGAMATVYEVVRVEDGERFALKVMRSVGDARLLARFAREAHIAAEVNHPNVVAIHDIDFAEAGFMYLVMDLVDGRSLKDCAERFGEEPWALAVLEQIARGLAAIHAMGVVHRDLKPANILIDGDGDAPRVKISDFGVSGMSEITGEHGTSPSGDEGADPALPFATQTHALPRSIATPTTQPPAAPRRSRITIPATPSSSSRSADSLDTPQLTRADHVLGTPAYMAPELQDARGDDAARDVYALGVIAFELLAKQRPYAGVPFLQRARGEEIGAPAALSALCPKLPAAIAAVFDAAVQLERDARPSVQQVLAALTSGPTRADAPRNPTPQPNQPA